MYHVRDRPYHEKTVVRTVGLNGRLKRAFYYIHTNTNTNIHIHQTKPSEKQNHKGEEKIIDKEHHDKTLNVIQSMNVSIQKHKNTFQNKQISAVQIFADY